MILQIIPQSLYFNRNLKLFIIKLIILFIMIANTLILAACSIGGSRVEMLNKNNDAEMADARIEQVIKAIKDQDKDTLRGMFSKQALCEAQDIDIRMEYLFGLFQGEVESWENLNGEPTIYETNDSGHKTKRSKSYFYVNTSKQKYFFFISEYTVDTKNPGNVGVYTLLIIKAEDKEMQWDNGGDDTFYPGIYKPAK